jgi:hypothetical protein
VTQEQIKDLNELIQVRVQRALEKQRAELAEAQAQRDVETFTWNLMMQAKKEREAAAAARLMGK